MILRRLAALSTVLLLAAACGSERVTNRDPVGDPSLRPAPPLTGSMEADRAELARLEEAARELARTEGCDSGASCATAPVGAKACGGPRYYLTYCRLSTDEARLRLQLDEVERFERAFNARYGIASTCDFVSAPPVEAVGGSCRAAARP
jgi:hypothetical protein